MTATTTNLPQALYSPHQIRDGEIKVAESLDLPMYELMERAGRAVFSLVQTIFREPANMIVVVGKGNNGGDGYVVARLALHAGWKVKVAVMPEAKQLEGEALTARQAWLAKNDVTFAAEQMNYQDADVIIDAILGTGGSKAVNESWSVIFDKINDAAALKFAVDVPSGLNAASGQPYGNVIKADHTVTFIGVKSGLMTGAAREYCGQLHFAGLGIEQAFAAQIKPYYQSVEHNLLRSLLPARIRHAHKGNHGKVLCIGGDKGLSGAIRLAAEACLRSGAGLVKVLTHPDNVAIVANTRPELMVSGVNGINQDVKDWIDWASVIIVGPGMGQTGWANGLMKALSDSKKPMVLDADALNWLAKKPQKFTNRILTPHPGEAAKLLKQNIHSIEADRFASAYEIRAQFGGVCVLKGAGTIIAAQNETSVCSQGNPGMATAGMGDVLAGIIGALLGQGLSLQDAAQLGVCIHAQAADQAAMQGERGMIASDLFAHLRNLLNENR